MSADFLAGRPGRRGRSGAATRTLPRTGAALALGMAALLTPHLAAAWGPVGHEAVGAVADALLTARTQAAVTDLLADDRDRDGRFSGRRSLAQVAGWADEIRGGPGDHPHWHYDNRPVCGPPVEAGAWCPQGDCASAQLPALLATLADPGRPRAERNVALKWIVHLVGDLHQPLHAADLAEGANRIRVMPHEKSGRSWDSGGDGDGSNGGNGVGRGGMDGGSASGELHGRHGHGHSGESLHAFWDSHLVNLALHPDEGRIPAAALASLVRRARAEGTDRVDAAPERWAEESNAIARDFALDIDGVDCSLGNGRGNGEEPHVRLSRAYVSKGRALVQERLALAGARLARVLNQALGARGGGGSSGGWGGAVAGGFSMPYTRLPSPPAPRPRSGRGEDGRFYQAANGSVNGFLFFLRGATRRSLPRVRGRP